MLVLKSQSLALSGIALVSPNREVALNQGSNRHRLTATRSYSRNMQARGHRGAEVPAVPQLAEQRRRTPQEGPGAADECGAML
jgi:hypothetical protein